MLYKLLSAKTRVYRHDQHHIEVGNNIAEQRYRRMRVKRHTGTTSQFLNMLHGTVQVVAYLVMNGYPVGAGVFKVLQVAVWLDDHQMHVERLLGMLFHSFHH